MTTPTILSRLKTEFPTLVPGVGFSVLIAIVRYFSSTMPLWFAWQSIQLMLGVVGGHLLLMSEGWWKTKLHLESARSSWRQAHMLLILPLLGLFLVTSTRGPFGLGLLWGLSLYFFVDTWPFWFNNRAAVLATYFGNKEDALSWAGQLIAFFQISFVLITAALIVTR